MFSSRQAQSKKVWCCMLKTFVIPAVHEINPKEECGAGAGIAAKLLSSFALPESQRQRKNTRLCGSAVNREKL